MPAVESVADQDAFIDSCKTYFKGTPNKLANGKDEEEEQENAPAEEA